MGSLTFAGFIFLILWIHLWKDIWKALFCLKRNVPCVHDVQRLLWTTARRNGRLRTLYCCFYDGIKTSPPVYIACSRAWSFLHHSENKKTRKLDVIKNLVVSVHDEFRTKIYILHKTSSLWRFQLQPSADLLELAIKFWAVIKSLSLFSFGNFTAKIGKNAQLPNTGILDLDLQQFWSS